MTDHDFQKKFIQELCKRGYDQNSIYEEQNVPGFSANGRTKMDIVIHKGNVVLQAFEIKHLHENRSDMNSPFRLYKQKFGKISINAPIYCVTFNDDSGFEIYDENFIKQDIDKILNYDSLISRIDKDVERTLIKEIPRPLFYICYTASALLLIYLILTIIYSCHCTYCRFYTVSPMNLIAYIIAVVFALTPSILKLQPKLLMFQFGMLKFTLALADEYKPKF